MLFVLQETLEGLFATGHPGGAAGVFGHGGWWAIPLALAVGLLLALVLRVADRFARATSRPPVLRGVATLLFPDAVGPLRARPLATAAAGRAPPRLSSPLAVPLLEEVVCPQGPGASSHR